MEADDRNLFYPLLEIGDKRPIMNDNDGFYPESKRQCTEYLEYDHGNGSAAQSSSVLSSRQAQEGFFNGSGNALYQPNVDTNVPGYFGPQYSSGLPLLSDLPEFGPGYPAYETLSGFMSIPSTGVETYAPEFGNRIESFTDESPFSIITQTDSDLGIEYPFNSISQGEYSVIEEPNTTATKEKHASEASNPTTLWDGYTSMPLQLAGDYPSKLEKGDNVSQEIEEPISQSSGIVTSEPIGQIVRNEKTYLGQPINVHLLRR